MFGATTAEVMHCIKDGLYLYVLKRLFGQKHIEDTIVQDDDSVEQDTLPKIEVTRTCIFSGEQQTKCLE